jgi:transposase InsO family protein
LKANSGRYLLMTFIETFSKWGYAGWISATTAKETIRVYKAFLKAAPFKPQITLTDNGSEFSHAKFTQFLQSIGIKHKRQPTGTPAKHIENWNLNVRRAATKFRTTYETKRIKDFVPVYCKRYNNTVHNRTRASPNKVVKMSPEELDAIKKLSI